MAALTAVFALGIALGLALWPRVALPLWNPDGVVGPLVDAGFNPANNVARFLVVLLAPVALLALAARVPAARRALVAWPIAPATPQGIRRGRVLAVLVALAIVFALNARPFHDRDAADFFHEGEALGSAVAVLHGQAPYRDVVVVHGLVQDPLRAVAAFAVFGRSIAAARTLHSLLRVLALALLAVAVWVLLGRTPLLAVLALTALGLAVCFWGGFFVSFPPRDATTALFLALSALALEGLDGGSWPRLVAAAAAASGVAVAAFAYSIDRGYYLCATALAVWLVVALHRGRRSRRAAFLAASLAGAVAGAGVLMLALGDAVGAFARFAFVEVPRFKDLLDGYAYPIDRPFFLAAVVLIAALVYRIAAPVVCARGGGAWSAARDLATGNAVEIALVVAAVVFFRGALGRADYPHVGYSVWPALLVLLVIVARDHGARADAWLAARARWWRRAIVVGLAALSVLLIAAIPARGRIGEHFPLGRPDESYLAPAQREVLKALRGMLAPGESVLVLNNEALWYYLLDRASPSRYPAVWLAGTRAGDATLEAELREGRIRVALDSIGTLHAQVDGYALARRTPRAAAYVAAHFEERRQIGPYRLLVRARP